MDKPNEFVVVDMTAGADAFASGLFTRFDLTLIVVEPTPKSLSVYEQYKDYAQAFGVNMKAIGNKIEDEEDMAYLQRACGADLIGCFARSSWVKRTERGEALDIGELEPENLKILNDIVNLTSTLQRDWDTYWQQGIFFHNRNAASWANEEYDCDLTKFLDEDFIMKLKS